MTERMKREREREREREKRAREKKGEREKKKTIKVFLLTNAPKNCPVIGFIQIWFLL